MHSSGSKFNVQRGEHAYKYDDDGRLTEIHHRSGPEIIIRRYVIDYNGERITRVRLNYPQTGGADDPGPIYKISYGTDGNPSEVMYYENQEAAEPLKTIKLTHDDKGRISKKENFFDGILGSAVRYVYNEENNVIERYLYLPIMDVEILDIEYVEYDDRKRFFASSPELEFAMVYIFDYDPSTNNAIRVKEYAGPSNPPLERKFSLEYDENKYVNSLTTSDVLSDVTVLFVGMDYDCK